MKQEEITRTYYFCDYCGYKNTLKNLARDHERACRIKKGISDKWGGTKKWNKSLWDEKYNDIVRAIKEHHDYDITGYGSGRWLDDNDSPFYGMFMSMYNICQVCWKEHVQIYDANHCNHQS